MRRSFLLSLVLLSAFFDAAQSATKKVVAKNRATTPGETGYHIPIKIVPFKNTWVYLGCYYGKFKNLVDSAWINEKSEGVFKGDKKLTGGIYFLVSPSKNILFEMLMDDGQHFSVQADTSKPNEAVITGSKENTLYQEYIKYVAQRAPQLTALQGSLSSARTKADTLSIRTKIVAINKDLNAYREGIINNNSSTMLAMFFRSIKRPEVPDLRPGQPYPVYWARQHFWDDVPFNDDRLLHTPFFDPKVDDYYKYYVSPEPDSVIAEVNYMLLYARTGKEMFQYLLGKFTDEYISPKIMGQDKVFLFLFNNFFAKGDTAWLSASQKKYIFDRAYFLMGNQIGGPAPILDLVDTANAATPMYNIQAPFTFIVFWDPNCGHCKIEVPKVDSIYQAKWKAEGVKIYAVNTAEGTMPEWKKFIQEHHLSGWYNVYQTKEDKKKDEEEGRANYRQLYDVTQTPTFYLLDENKHIIAKKLSIEQFDGLIDLKLKNPSTPITK